MGTAGLARGAVDSNHAGGSPRHEWARSSIATLWSRKVTATPRSSAFRWIWSREAADPLQRVILCKSDGEWGGDSDGGHGMA